ncbi:MAG: sensor histidine kinase [Gemmatimonadaceae bacterium]
MRHIRRFWFSYSLAWLPYFAGYVAIFLVVRNATLVSALLGSLVNVVPAALLGVAAVSLTGRLSWSQPNRLSFLALHAVFATAYSLLWFASLTAGLLVQAGIERGSWTVTMFRGPALMWQLLQGALLYLVVVGITYAVRASAAVRELEARAIKAEALRTAAELQALRARLDPHFLFNTLHSVIALVRHNTAAAETALERFADMLRYVLNTGRDRLDDASVRDEWTFVQDYLALEKLRLGARLRVVADIDPESLDWPVPAFTLQPLVENAIRHALAPRSDGGTLWIASSASDDVLRLEVRDDGAGTHPDTIDRASGTGLRLVRQRLEARYGACASMTIHTAPGAGFSVVVCVPFATSPPLFSNEQ